MVGPDNHVVSNHQGEEFSELGLGDVSNDIDEEGGSNDDNVYALLLGNPTCGIIIRNDPSTHMLNVDPDVAMHLSSLNTQI
ncbi:hypothetical protein GOBAR_DD05848 [Gossypium barbadense]|nr:hypothetical protein GOBAR_DD05848 [Gossypium barbadense]